MQNIISFLEVENYIARVYAGKRCAVKPFYIPFNFGTVAISGSATVQQKIPSNADFLLMRLSYSQTAITNGAYPSIQFLDGGTNEQFYPSAIPIMDVADVQTSGPNDQSVFRRLAGNSLISGTLTNQAAVQLTTAVVTMAGVLVYVYSGQ